MIHRVPFFLPWLYPNLVWRIPTALNEIYLTFDDGPVPGPTDFVLETLDKYSVKATFFCIGNNIEKHPELFRKLLRDGHTPANHTFNHKKGWHTNLNNYLRDTEACENQLRSFGVEKNRLFRPPYGRITRNQIAALIDQYQIVMWDVLTMDYNRGLNREKCLKNSIKAVRPGSIIVFHDSVKAENNMAYALPRLIEYFLEKNYSFKVLS